MIVFVRHAEAVVDEHAPSAEWPLAPGAADTVRALAPRLPPLPRVVTSEMRRARDTGALLGPPTVADARLNEVTRPWSDDLERAVAQYLHGETLDGWEPQADAIGRVAASVAEHGDAIYVTHGTVLSLYLSTVVADFDAFTFWRDLVFAEAWTLRGHEISRTCEKS